MEKNQRIEQDIRIVQLRNFYGVNNFRASDGKSSYRAFSYFDEITVHPVSQKGEKKDKHTAVNLYDGYRMMQKLFRTNMENQYRSQQLIMAFTEVENEGKRKEINRFWRANETAMLFLTLVNVSLSASLEETVKRIRDIYSRQNYLIYYSLEYNEILIFCKTDSFQKYMDIVARLNYAAVTAGKPPVLDTLTICGFREKSKETEEDSFDAYLCLGATDYQKLQNYLEAVEGETGLSKQTVEHRWTIGRNDMSIFLRDVTLKQLYTAYKIYTDKYAEESPWISTFDLTIWIRPNEDETLTGSTALQLWEDAPRQPCYQSLRASFRTEIEELKEAYQQLYKRMGIKEDLVFLRFLYDLESMVTNRLTVQLARDLAACLIPQFRDFVRYMTKVCKETAREPLPDALKSRMEETVNTFYLNVTTLVNSTVHSDRQFIQIPHCGVTAFEMPPKLMAYYSIMAHRIVSVLADSPEVLYGVMLSPKLVDVLEVEPMPLDSLSEPNHMMSVNISEEMLYHPHRTVLILGHEMAHFVGNSTRLRSWRRQLIAAYHIQKILTELLSAYRDRLGNPPLETLDQVLDQGDLLAFARTLAERLFSDAEKAYELDASRQRLEGQVRNLGPDLLQNGAIYQAIVEGLLFPAEGNPLFQQSLKRYMAGHLKGFGLHETEAGRVCDVRMLRLRGEALFADTAESYIGEWIRCHSEQVGRDYRNVTSYLFSESYADVCMVLLYDMTPEEYLKLFIHGRKNDAAELARFRAVVRAMRRRGLWTEKDVPPADEDDKDAWKKTLHMILSYSLKSAWREEYTAEIIRAGYRLDLVLQSVLTEYLEGCVDALRERFAGEKAAELKALQRIYRSVDPDSSAYHAVVAIRKLEQERLCMNQAQPNKSE